MQRRASEHRGNTSEMRKWQHTHTHNHNHTNSHAHTRADQHDTYRADKREGLVCVHHLDALPYLPHSHQDIARWRRGVTDGTTCTRDSRPVLGRRGRRHTRRTRGAMQKRKADRHPRLPRDRIRSSPPRFCEGKLASALAWLSLGPVVSARPWEGTKQLCVYANLSCSARAGLHT